jgi:hypothetical protein
MNVPILTHKIYNSMKTKHWIFSLILIIGVVLGCIVAYAIRKERFEQSKNAEPQNDLYKAFERCNQAYIHEKPEIAAQELGKFIRNSMQNLPPANDPIYQVYCIDLFIANARLAKIYQKLGDHEESEHHFRLAITNYNEVGKIISEKYSNSITTSISITNDADVLNLLQEFDAKMK